MAHTSGEICNVRKSERSRTVDPLVLAEANRFESILKEAFGAPKSPSLLTKLSEMVQSPLRSLGAEESRIDNIGPDERLSAKFRDAVYDQVRHDLAHDKLMPATLRQGPLSPYLSIDNRVQNKANAALPEVNIVINTDCKS